jgi:bifunctional non-homologous end joining protein LigD
MSCLRTRGTSGHIEPCLPSQAERPSSGDGWIHEIKHDGYRIMARRDSTGVRLITRHGNDFTVRFPLAVEVVSALPARSFLSMAKPLSPTSAVWRCSTSFGMTARRFPPP